MRNGKLWCGRCSPASGMGSEGAKGVLFYYYPTQQNNNTVVTGAHTTSSDSDCRNKKIKLNNN